MHTYVQNNTLSPGRSAISVEWHQSTIGSSNSPRNQHIQCNLQYTDIGLQGILLGYSTKQINHRHPAMHVCINLKRPMS